MINLFPAPHFNHIHNDSFHDYGDHGSVDGDGGGGGCGVGGGASGCVTLLKKYEDALKQVCPTQRQWCETSSGIAGLAVK